jgi:hypothetical protein
MLNVILPGVRDTKRVFARCEDMVTVRAIRGPNRFFFFTFFIESHPRSTTMVSFQYVRHESIFFC